MRRHSKKTDRMRYRRMLILWFLVYVISQVNCSPTKDDNKKKVEIISQTVDKETELPKTWPWQVGISILKEDKYEFKCGGTLISNDVVMTAAHCLQTPAITRIQFTVTAGDIDRSVIEGTEQTREVLKIKTHPNYTGTLSSLYNDDIALLKLSKPFTPSAKIALIPVTSSDDVIDYTTTCYVIGWGLTDTKTRSTATTNPLSVLSEAEMRILTNEECNKRNYWDSLINLTQICAFNKKVSACMGDSGGPLVCHVNGTYVQYGITSWGTKSCDRRPSVFTFVPRYASWINQTMIEFDQPTQLKSLKLTDAFAVKSAEG